MWETVVPPLSLMRLEAGFAATQHTGSLTPGPYLGCVCVLEAESWCGTQADLLVEAINLPASALGGEYRHA